MNTKEQKQNQYPFMVAGYKFIAVFTDGDYYDAQHFKTLSEAKMYNKKAFNGMGKAMNVKLAMNKYEFFYYAEL